MCVAFAISNGGRSQIVKKDGAALDEWGVRGYLAGSGWKDYQQTGSVSG